MLPHLLAQGHTSTSRNLNSAVQVGGANCKICKARFFLKSNNVVQLHLEKMDLYMLYAISYMLLKYLAAFKMNTGLILAKWVTRLGMYWNRMERLQLCCTANCGSSILLIFFTKTVVVWRYSFVYTNQFFNLIYFILNKEAWVGPEWNINKMERLGLDRYLKRRKGERKGQTIKKRGHVK